MGVLNAWLDLFRQLRRADDVLQVLFEDLLRRYYRFVKDPLRHGTRHLRLRRHRDRDRRIRALSWTERLRATRRVGPRTLRMTRGLAGGLRSSWVYEIAKDWTHRETYYAFEGERRRLLRARHQVVAARRALAMSFMLKWGRGASGEDLARAGELITSAGSGFSGRDLRVASGIVAFGQRFEDLEAALGRTVEEYRTTFKNRTEVNFEPALRRTDGGTLRVFWGFPQRVDTAEGSRLFTDYIAGRPTDLWMRRERLRAGTRLEVAVFVRRLAALQREYAELVSVLGRARQRVHELAARVEGMKGAQAPSTRLEYRSPLGGLG